MPSGVDVHQLNCTYYSALGEDDDRYLAARAIQLFARGIPQVYYVGLLAGANDHAAVGARARAVPINRHDYTPAEIDAALARPVVRRILELVRLRATHPAFAGRLRVTTPGRTSVRLAWMIGADSCGLEVDLVTGRIVVDD